MKLQSLGVLFVLIILPIILVLTYYVQLQVDTVELQTQYDSKLLDSTYDAMSSFEINTANEDLSTVSDSLRTIVEASTNTFFNTLATNLGMSNASKSALEPYIPAVLYTLYDGYYIYAPTKTVDFVKTEKGTPAIIGEPGVRYLGNGKFEYTGDETHIVDQKDLVADGLEELYGSVLTWDNAPHDPADPKKGKYKNKSLLKSYIPYSARYHQTDGQTVMDVTCVFTLDNFVSIEGTVISNGTDPKIRNEEYYTKSGYLIGQDSVEITIGGRPIAKLEGGADDKIMLPLYNQETVKKLIESGQYDVIVKIKEDPSATIEYKSDTAFKSKQSKIDEINRLKTEIEKGNEVEKNNKAINELQYELDLMSASIYYSQAQLFSIWVHNTFGKLRENSLVQISGQDYASIEGVEQVLHDFKNKGPNDYVFGFSGDQLKINDHSNFFRHKTAVIRDSIQYNLNLAMSTYNMNAVKGYEYSMPVLSTEEWNQIINNVSIVSFMQGFKCGLSVYNNYKVVSSTNNEFMPIEENMYFIPIDNFNDTNSIAHRINCEKLDKDAEKYLAFTSKDLKYDKIYDKNSKLAPYKYDHRNYSCYDCIVDGNHSGYNLFDNKTLDPHGPLNDTQRSNLRKAYYIGIAKERNNTYKMNAFDISDGYEFIFSSFSNKDVEQTDIIHDSSLSIKNIKAVEVVVGTLYASDRNETTLSFRVSADGIPVNDEVYSVTANSLNNNTMYIEFDPNTDLSKKTSKLGKANLHFHIQNANSSLSYKDPNINSDDKEAVFKNSIKSIRVFYK